MYSEQLTYSLVMFMWLLIFDSMWKHEPGYVELGRGSTTTSQHLFLRQINSNR